MGRCSEAEGGCAPADENCHYLMYCRANNMSNSNTRCRTLSYNRHVVGNYSLHSRRPLV